MENQDNLLQNENQEAFDLGRSAKADVDKKKKKKNENVAEERIKQTFNLSGNNDKEHDELKRKREDFAV